jgi:hypothetical protein
MLAPFTPGESLVTDTFAAARELVDAIAKAAEAGHKVSVRLPGHAAALEVLAATSTDDLATFKSEEASHLVTLQALQGAVVTIDNLDDDSQRLGFAMPARPDQM